MIWSPVFTSSDGGMGQLAASPWITTRDGLAPERATSTRVVPTSTLASNVCPTKALDRKMLSFPAFAPNRKWISSTRLGLDRKSVVSGKGVSVRVDLGGGR